MTVAKYLILLQAFICHDNFVHEGITFLNGKYLITWKYLNILLEIST